MRFWACFASMWDLLLVCGGFGWNREVFGMSAFWVTLVIGSCGPVSLWRL